MKAAAARRSRAGAFSFGLLVALSTTHIPACRTLDTVEWAVPRALQLPSPEVSFDLARQDEFVAIEASLEGHGPHSIVLDTGSAYFLISQTIARSLLKRNPRETGPFVVDWLGQEKEIGRFFRVSSARLGPVELKDVAVMSVDFGEWRSVIGRAPEGFIGLKAFPGKYLTIDFRSGVMQIRDTAPDALPPAEAAVPFRWSLGTVKAEISIAGERRWATIDSGSSVGLKLPRSTDWPILGDWQPWGILRDLYSTKSYSVARLGGDVRIGDTILPSPWVQSSEEFPQVNVGMGVLKHFRLTLDTKNGLLWLEGPDEKRLIFEEPKPSGPAMVESVAIPPSASAPDR